MMLCNRNCLHIPSARTANHYQLLLGIVFVLAFLPLFKPWIHGFDTVGYYSWLHSAVIDGNLDVKDEFAHYGYGQERGITATGHTYNDQLSFWPHFF